MSATLAATTDAHVENSVRLLECLLAGITPREFAVRFWNGFTMKSTAGRSPEFTLVLRHAGALRRMFSSPSELALGEAYIYDDYDIEGDVEAAVRLGKRLMGQHRSVSERLRVGALLARLPNEDLAHRRQSPRLRGRLHSRKRDRDAIQYHYNVSNDFYALFLDARMNYSEAFFAHSDENLDAAQEHKLDRICRSLELQPGERFLDIGCGWGGLIMHAAREFGVEALGITLSEQQAGLARQRIRAAGLENRCRVEICDYRDVGPVGSFDKLASIGMVEHVGARYLPQYFSTARRLLRPGGAFLNSGIARPVSEPAHREGSFTEVYVFPDGELEPISELLSAAEQAGFEVRSVENLREHYALTLRHWVRRLECHADEARRLTDDVTYRIWRLYMAGSAARFTTGELDVFHTLIVSPKAGS